MRYARAERLIQLALEMQAARTGLTITDIMEKFTVSRRTAIRMRDAVIRAFPQADEVQSDDRSKRWRLTGGNGQWLAGVTADDLSAVETAIRLFERDNLQIHAESLRTISAKLRGQLQDDAIRRIDPDLEALLEAEGIAHRPGPRPLISGGVFETLRQAIKSCRKVSFVYESRSKNRAGRRTVCPLGLLYGHRHYLVADQQDGKGVRHFSLPAISELQLEAEGFSPSPEFSLRDIVGQCFGVYHEAPVEVIWRFSPTAAPLASQFVFHPSQSCENEPDGSLLVRFHAGGLLEMAWHLMSWGKEVEVIAPAELRQMLPAELPDWPALP